MAMAMATALLKLIAVCCLGMAGAFSPPVSLTSSRPDFPRPRRMVNSAVARFGMRRPGAQSPVQLRALFGIGESKKTKVGVIGATGGVGRLVVAYLLEQGCDVKAVVRDKARATELLPPSIEFAVGDTVDPTLGDGLAAAISGVDALIIATGTTAFPTDKWGPNKENNPQAVDEKGVQNVVAAVCDVNRGTRTIKKISLLSSIGIERRAQFPFNLLNFYGVLDAKYAGECAVAAAAESAGYAYAFARLGRLVGGPYTGTPDVASLLQLDEGDNQAITMVKGDPAGFKGDLSRKQGAMALVQAALNDKDNIAFAIVNKPGPPPTQADWDAAFEFPPVEEDTSFAFLIEDLARKAAQTWALVTKVMPGKE